jgi:hypothetical protein
VNKTGFTLTESAEIHSRSSSQAQSDKKGANTLGSPDQTLQLCSLVEINVIVRDSAANTTQVLRTKSCQSQTIFFIDSLEKRNDVKRVIVEASNVSRKLPLRATVNIPQKKIVLLNN